MFITDDEEAAIERGMTGCPVALRDQAWAWINRLWLGKGMVENVINGYSVIVGFSNGEPEFMMTPAGGDYIKRELEKLGNLSGPTPQFAHRKHGDDQ